MELIQIGSSPAKPLTIREMFEQMAQREAEMVRAVRRASTAKTQSLPQSMQH